MKIVPAGEGLPVEARVANEDIGRLRVGMPAEIKVRAFDYLRFGKIDGAVRSVAADATPEPRDRCTLAYTVTVAADRDRLGVDPGQPRWSRAWWSTSTSRSASARSSPT